MAMDFDPGHMSTVQPLATQIDGDKFTNFSASDFAFWKSPDSDEYLISDSTESSGRFATLSGPVRLWGESYFLTSAHILTNKSPFDSDVAIVSPRSTGIILDYAPDETDDEPASDEDLASEWEPQVASDTRAEVLELNSGINDSSEASDVPFASHLLVFEDTELTFSGDHDIKHVPQMVERRDTGDTESLLHPSSKFKQINWPASYMQVFVGSEPLDCAFIKLPAQVLDKALNDITYELEAYAPNHGTREVPSGNVVIRVAGRSALTGTFDAHPIGFYFAQYCTTFDLWLYIPDRAGADLGVSENSVRLGDSGALVVDKVQKIVYGHVVAGSPSRGTAYIVPVQSLLDDVGRSHPPAVDGGTPAPEQVVADVASHDLIKDAADDESISLRNLSDSPEKASPLAQIQLRPEIVVDNPYTNADEATHKSDLDMDSQKEGLQTRSRNTPEAEHPLLFAPFIVPLGGQNSPRRRGSPKVKESLSKMKALYPDLGRHGVTRLVIIEQSSVEDESVRCTTRPVEDLSSFSYCVLSCDDTAGSQKSRLNLNGHDVLVDLSVVESLRFSRAADQIIVWIDVLCIDPKDPQDRERQARYLPKIFTRARCVVVRLDCSTSPENKDTWRQMERSLSLLCKTDLDWPLVRTLILGIVSICSDRMWQRGRGLLELILARQVYVIHGKAEADLDSLLFNIKRISENMPADGVLDAAQMNRLNFIWRLREQRHAGGAYELSLFESLLFSRHFRFESEAERIMIARNLSDHGTQVAVGNYHEGLNEDSLVSIARYLYAVTSEIAAILLCRQVVSSPTRYEPDLLRASDRIGTPPAIEASKPPKQYPRSGIALAGLVWNFRQPSWVPRWSALEHNTVPPWIIGSIENDWFWRRWLPRVDVQILNDWEDILYPRGIVLEQINALSSVSRPAWVSNYAPSTVIDEHYIDRVQMIRGAWLSEKLERDQEPTKHVSVALLECMDVVQELWLTIIAPIMRDQCSGIYEQQRLGYALESCILENESCVVAAALATPDTSMIDYWMKANRRMSIRGMPLEFWIKVIARKPYHAADDSLSIYRKEAYAHILSAALAYLNEHGLRLACTTHKTLRLVYERAQKGDHIAYLEGCPLPVVLRPADSSETIVVANSSSAVTLSFAERLAARRFTAKALRLPTSKTVAAAATARRPTRATRYEYIGEVYLEDYDHPGLETLTNAFDLDDDTNGQLVKLRIV